MVSGLGLPGGSSPAANLNSVAKSFRAA